MAGRTRRVLTSPVAFWDTSALVPLCTRQRFSAAFLQLLDIYEIAVWWATSVELASALARLNRMGHIDSNELIAAQQIVRTLETDWSVVRPSESLRVRASANVANFSLRAADALQLAAALQWCENQPAGRIFLTADDKLREAAQRSGFDVPVL